MPKQSRGSAPTVSGSPARGVFLRNSKGHDHTTFALLLSVVFCVTRLVLQLDEAKLDFTRNCVDLEARYDVPLTRYPHRHGLGASVEESRDG